MFFVESEKSIPADVRDVLDTAALLQVTEFRLFQLAYRHWHGRDISERSIERYFIPYMFHAVVPFWVRQLCRRVLRADTEGTLNPAEFGIELCQQREDPYRQYLRVLAVAGTALGMLGIACSLFLGY